MRAVDEMPEGTEDLPHFERAAALGRVLVTNDAGQEARAHQWYEDRRRFPGLIVWRQAIYDHMSYGDLVEAFEALAREDARSRYTRLCGSGRNADHYRPERPFK